MNKSQTEIKLKPQYNPTISGFKNFVIAYNRGIQEGKLQAISEFERIIKKMIKEDIAFLRRDIDTLNVDICAGYKSALVEVLERIEKTAQEIKWANIQ